MAKKTGWADLGFLKKEVTLGTLIAPTATDVVRFVGAPTPYQAKNLLVNEERIDSYSHTEQIAGRSNAGTFTLNTYFKASGAAGTAPPAALHGMLEGVMGRTTNNVGVSQQYDPLRTTDTRPSFSFFYRTGDGLVLQNAGCLFTGATIQVNSGTGQDSILQGTFNGVFMKQYQAGRGVTAAGSTTTAVVMATGNSKRFNPSVGTMITITGFTPNPTTVTSINYGTDTLTVPTLSGSPGAAVNVQGYMPSPTDSGYKLSSWKGQATIGGVNFNSTKWTITIANNLLVLVDEKNSTEFPNSFIEGTDKRLVTLEGTIYLDQADMDKWYAVANQTQFAIVIPVGDVAGKIFEFRAPQCELMETPALDSSGPVMQTLKFKALASAALDDEFQILAK